jgi:hypothetical protein
MRNYLLTSYEPLRQDELGRLGARKVESVSKSSPYSYEFKTNQKLTRAVVLDKIPRLKETEIQIAEL